jgi:hypothetical protein
MKKVRLLALFVILIAVVANGSPRLFDVSTGLLCGGSNDPSLCPGGVDVGCSDFCDSVCTDFTNVTGTCSPNGHCSCHGTPIH